MSFFSKFFFVLKKKKKEKKKKNNEIIRKEEKTTSYSLSDIQKWYNRAIYLRNHFNEEFEPWKIILHTPIPDWILMQATLYSIDWNQICEQKRFIYVLLKRLEQHWPCKTWIYFNDFKNVQIIAERNKVAAETKINVRLPSQYTNKSEVRNRLPEMLPRQKQTINSLLEYTRSIRQTMWSLYESDLSQHLEQWMQKMAHMESHGLFPDCSSQVPNIPRVMFEKAQRLWVKNQKSNQNQNHDMKQDIEKSWIAYQSLVMNNHALAIPSNIWYRLVNEMKLDMEGFSCVFNSHEGSFCSPFPNLDKPFGAVANFFSMKWYDSPYQVIAVDPPYVEEVLIAASTHLLHCLVQAEEQKKSLTFLCCYPRWDDAEGFLMLKQSPFKRYLFYLNSVPFEDLHKKYKTISSYYIMLSTSFINVNKQVLLIKSILESWQAMSTKPKNKYGHATYGV